VKLLQLADMIELPWDEWTGHLTTRGVEPVNAATVYVSLGDMCGAIIEDISV